MLPRIFFLWGFGLGEPQEKVVCNVIGGSQAVIGLPQGSQALGSLHTSLTSHLFPLFQLKSGHVAKGASLFHRLPASLKLKGEKSQFVCLHGLSVVPLSAFVLALFLLLHSQFFSLPAIRSLNGLPQAFHYCLS